MQYLYKRQTAFAILFSSLQKLSESQQNWEQEGKKTHPLHPQIDG